MIYCIVLPTLLVVFLFKEMNLLIVFFPILKNDIDHQNKTVKVIINDGKTIRLFISTFAPTNRAISDSNIMIKTVRLNVPFVFIFSFNTNSPFLLLI